jgi:hypothetical protein
MCRRARRNAAGRIAVASARASRISTLSREGQYAYARVEANRSAPYWSWRRRPFDHQVFAPRSRPRRARLAESSRKKSTWCAYSCWTIPQASRPAASVRESSQISPRAAAQPPRGTMWIVTRAGTRLQSKPLAASAARTVARWAVLPPENVYPLPLDWARAGGRARASDRSPAAPHTAANPAARPSVTGGACTPSPPERARGAALRRARSSSRAGGLPCSPAPESSIRRSRTTER